MKRCLFLLTVFLWACSSTNDSNSADQIGYTSMNLNELKIELDQINLEIRKNINEGDLYLERALIFKVLNDFQGALADVDRALNIDPNKARYLQEKGELMILKRDFKQAENALFRCAQLDRENTVCRIKLAEYYFYMRKFKDAMAWTNQVLRIDKYDADAYFIKGMIHLASGDTSLSISSFQTAVEQNSDFFEAYFELGSLLGSKGNVLAIEYYNNAIRIKPGSVDSYYNKGLLSQELGMYNEALVTYTELLKIEPNYKKAHFNMGYVNMYYLKEYKQGAVHFSNAIRVAPEYHEAYYNRGYCYELLGDIRRALVDYNNALEVKPDYTLAAKGKERVIVY